MIAAGRSGPWHASRLLCPHLGRHVELWPLSPDEMAPDLYDVSHGSAAKEEVWSYLRYGPFASVEAMRDWLHGCTADQDTLFFGVGSLEARRWIGMCSFLHVEPSMRRLEVGHIWYGSEYQRTGANTEAAYLLLRRAFDQLGYRRVEWLCNSWNEASRRAALRLGFRLEGVLAQHQIAKGKNRDTAIFSLVDGDWADCRSALERWLSMQAGERPSLAALRERPHEHAVPWILRDARKDDVREIVALLADDRFGKEREHTDEASLARYLRAFARMEASSLVQEIVVEHEGRVAAARQVTWVPSLVHGGGTRCALEGVFVRRDLRGQGVGRRLVQHVLDRARRRDCVVVELTSPVERTEARRFYESLGFQASHHGMKLALAPAS